MIRRLTLGPAALAATVMLLVMDAVHAAMVPAPPSVGARAYILMDATSGHVIASEDPQMKVEPASLTKIMTVYVAATELAEGRLTLEETTRVSEKAWKTGGSRMFIQVDSKVSVGDLLKGIIVQSGNDASVALAEHIAGTEAVFASMMNRHAEDLGMKGSHFANATGLPNEQTFTTAADMATLTRSLIAQYPDIYAGFGQTSFTYNGIRQPNRNRLLFRDESVDGVKTGHTESAGYCLVASAERGGMRLISVVVGTASDEARTEASRALLEYGFRFFETRRVYEGGAAIAQQKVWKGRSPTFGYGFENDVTLTFPRGHYEDVEVAVDLADDYVAPIAAGERVGEARFVLDGETLLLRELVATEAVPRAGLLRRVLDSVKMLVF